MRYAAVVLLFLHWGCFCSHCAAEDTQFTLDQYYESPTAEQIEEPLIEDSAVELAGYGGQQYMGCNSCRDCNTCTSGTQTVSWLSGPYFKVGLTGVLGTSLLENNRKTGYAISLGGRQPLGPGMGGRRMFFDVGGSYLSAQGETVRNYDGLQTTTINGMTSTTVVVDAFRESLTEIRRGGAHAGVGCYFGSLLDNRSEDPQARLGLVVGGRLSHIHGVFRRQQLVAPPVVTPPDTSSISQITTPSHSDMAGGIYVDVEALLLKRNSPLGDLQWTIDGEFANDWIEFSNFNQGSLGTASLMFGFMVVR